MTDAELDRLDRLAAEKLMLATRVQTPNSDRHPKDIERMPERWGWKYSDKTGSQYIDEVDWQPTRRIEQAFQLLEKTLPLSPGHDWEISGPSENCWQVCLENERGERKLYGSADTAPLAITLACLKSRGIEV